MAMWHLSLSQVMISLLKYVSSFKSLLLASRYWPLPCAELLKHQLTLFEFVPTSVADFIVSSLKAGAVSFFFCLTLFVFPGVFNLVAYSRCQMIAEQMNENLRHWERNICERQRSLKGYSYSCNPLVCHKFTLILISRNVWEGQMSIIEWNYRVYSSVRMCLSEEA